MNESAITHGTLIIQQKYYDGAVIKTNQSVEVDKFTDRYSLLKDIIEALEVITNGTTDELNICIKLDKKGRYLIRRRWDI